MSFNSLSLIIIICIIFQALFSAAETAFFSLSKIDLKKLEKDNNISGKRVLALLKKNKQLLITTLLGSNLVSIYATAKATRFAIQFSEGFTALQTTFVMVALVFIMTVLLLLFGEIIPKLYAFSKPILVAKCTTLLIFVVRFLFYPIIMFLEWLLVKISKKKDTNLLTKTTLSHEDLRNIVQSESQNLPLEENEKKIIDSIFRFPSTTVKEIMVPRVDIEGIELNSSLNDLKKIIIESGYSRIPVYKKTLDEIIGVIYAKDLILYPEKRTLHTLQRKPFFIPENMKIEALLNLFQSSKKLIAIVVDEYGGTSGLVTLEDILEEIVGEIMDEYDDEQDKIVKLSKNNYLISAMVSTAELNREFNLHLNEEFDNLAEFLSSELNHIPKKNEKYVYNENVEFVVTQIKKQRVHFVKMEIKND